MRKTVYHIPSGSKYFKNRTKFVRAGFNPENKELKKMIPFLGREESKPAKSTIDDLLAAGKVSKDQYDLLLKDLNEKA